ncbi:MAG: inner membrane CreD family protein [Deltaproteobacteria bacterium]|nr:inner membrane CreD family protein [Deltaproteobacteria bacterium]
MNPVLRAVGIVFVFIITAVSWFVLAGVTDSRNSNGRWEIRQEVGSLWGNAQVQRAPEFQLRWEEEVVEKRDVTDANGTVITTRYDRRAETRSRALSPASTRADVKLHLDERRRGLFWFPLYDVDFDGTWTVSSDDTVRRALDLTFRFPDENAMYDDFHLVVDGAEVSAVPRDGAVTTSVWIDPGQVVTLAVSYQSRGADTWQYQPSQGVTQVKDFQLAMVTDFDRIDFPVPGLSPTAKLDNGEGWDLRWDFASVVTGFGAGMIMPTRIQPGELATELAVSAPLSLGLFFLWVYVLGLLRDRQVHPINYLFIAAAFFAFNLLLAYSADHLPIEWAFGVSAGVSVLLVVSYLRLVVGVRFAFVEAGLAQLLYQVGFATAHFFDGFTGLTITVLGIVTLFALMQLTGRIDWSKAFARKPVSA